MSAAKVTGSQLTISGAACGKKGTMSQRNFKINLVSSFTSNFLVQEGNSLKFHANMEKNKINSKQIRNKTTSTDPPTQIKRQTKRQIDDYVNQPK